MQRTKRSPNSKVLTVTAAILVTVAAGFIWFMEWEAPRLIREKLTGAVEDSCGECRLEIGSIETPIARLGAVIASDVHLKTGTPGALEIDSRIERVTGHFVWQRLSFAQIHLSGLEIEKPVVSLTEGDAKPRKESSDKKEDAFHFAVDRILLTNGQFYYIRDHHGTHAKLLVHDIRIETSPVSNRGFEDDTVRASVTAQVEKSGTADLEVMSHPFKKELFVNVDLRVRRQNLADLTPFLKENAGVELSGILERGHSRIHVRGRSETARVWAEYHDLNVKIDEHYDRSGPEAFLTTLGADLTMSEANEDVPASDQERAVVYERKPHQSIAGFIIQGMKEAAIKVAKAK